MSVNNAEELNQNQNQNNNQELDKKEQEAKTDQKDLEEKIKKLKNDSSQAKVIDELPKNEIYQIKNVKTAYRIVYVYKNEDGFISAKPDLKIIDAIKRICKKLNITQEKIYIKYNDKTITEEDYDLTVKKFFDFPKNKSRPILYVKNKVHANNNNSIQKQSNNNYLSNSYDAMNKSNLYGKSSYTNKVKISNYPSMVNINVSANDDIYNIINNFLKEFKINSDFYVERKEEKKKQTNSNNEDENLDENNFVLGDNIEIIYYVSFPTPDIAFDFKRYLSILKLINPTFKDISIQLEVGGRKSPKKNIINKQILEEPAKNNWVGIYSGLEATNPQDKNIEVIAKIRNNYINNQMNKLNNINIYRYGYLNSSSPYSSPYDEVIKEKHENKKKWLNPKGFISSVNKYSGINF